MPHHPSDLRCLGSAVACLCVVLIAGLLSLVASAGAQSGGGATADPDGKQKPDPAASGTAKASEGKPVVVSAPPKPLLITCRSSCAGLDVVRPGGVVRVTGDAMAGAKTVVFRGAEAQGDEASGAAVAVAPDAVDVVVPGNAVSGPVQVLDGAGHASRVTGRTIGVAGPNRVALAGTGPDARVDVKQVFFRGPHQATLSVYVPEGGARHVSVDLLRESDGAVVGHWERDGAGGTVQSVSWSGIVDGSVQADGRYRFRVRETAPGTATAAQDETPPAPVFTFLGHIFPIRGRHDFGGDVARFGTGRAGHVHQGQDAFAACGTLLVAARGGTVKFQGFQGAAGNYVVIDGAGTGTDYVYMHLKAPATVVKGATVYTGQPIGEVGDTGDADGCHLHMELWSAPGWYTGGAPFDPLPSLKRWDKQS
ncbi:MAG: Peptidase [Solirubrobacterales bacterium]|nr:Peptidase [Solirubrobacterales bacterium]